MQWVGLLALLALAATGVGALAIVKDRVHITIRDGEASGAPNELALVRDDLAQIRSDLRAIAEGLDTNLRSVAAALAESTDEVAVLSRRASEPAPASGDARATTAELTALRTELSVLRAALVERALHGVPGTAPAAQPPAEPSPTEALPDAARIAAGDPPAPAGDGGTAASVPADDPSAPEPPAAAPARRDFLSFSLPSSEFVFDRANRYRLLPSLSRVGFDAKSTLHDFTGAASGVRGEIDANLADPSLPWRGSIRCTVATVITGVEGRDENMREHLAAEAHPEIVFDVTRFVPAQDGIDREARRARGTVEGRMTIRGVTREVAMPVEISIDDGQRVVVSGQMPLALPDYEVPVPSQLGLISMEPTVQVWVELRARAVGPAREVSDAR